MEVNITATAWGKRGVIHRFEEVAYHVASAKIVIITVALAHIGVRLVLDHCHLQKWIMQPQTNSTYLHT